MAMTAELKQIRKELWQTRVLQERIDNLRMHIAEAEAQANSNLGVDYSKIKVTGGNSSGSALEDAAIAAADYSAELARTISELVELYRFNFKLIQAVPDHRDKLFLEKRYLRHQTLEQIACDMDVSWRHIMRMHVKALRAAYNAKAKMQNNNVKK